MLCEAEMKQESEVVNTLSRLRVCVVKVAVYDNVVRVAMYNAVVKVVVCNTAFDVPQC